MKRAVIKVPLASTESPWRMEDINSVLVLLLKPLKLGLLKLNIVTTKPRTHHPLFACNRDLSVVSVLNQQWLVQQWWDCLVVSCFALCEMRTLTTCLLHAQSSVSRENPSISRLHAFINLPVAREKNSVTVLLGIVQEHESRAIVYTANFARLCGIRTPDGQWSVPHRAIPEQSYIAVNDEEESECPSHPKNPLVQYPRAQHQLKHHYHFYFLPSSAVCGEACFRLQSFTLVHKVNKREDMMPWYTHTLELLSGSSVKWVMGFLYSSSLLLNSVWRWEGEQREG